MLLVVDANILIGELLRKRGRELIQHPQLDLYISERVFSESNYELNNRVNIMVKQGKMDEMLGNEVFEEAKSIIDSFINVVPIKEYKHLENKAKKRIPRDPDDWECVAIALLLNIDIWTNDEDFLGCGIATWSTNTIRHYISGEI
jgi:predicted nucleic acid-binding protein